MKNLLTLVLLILTAFLLTQCLGGINDREDCDGSPELINPIPDTTVALSQDTLFIDLSGSDDSVFRHTAGKTMSMNFTISGRMSASVRYKNGNPNLGREAVIELKETGVFQASVFATDDCEKLSEFNDFELTITN